MEEKFKLDTIDIYVNENHRFGTDAVLLADFASPYPSETVCDLCTGCGIIPLFFCKNKPPKKIYGVELQKEAVELFKRSVKENGLENMVYPIQADLTDTKALLKHIPMGSLDTVTVNPPYYKENSGKTKLTEAQRIARHEIACNYKRGRGAVEIRRQPENVPSPREGGGNIFPDAKKEYTAKKAYPCL